MTDSKKDGVRGKEVREEVSTVWDGWGEEVLSVYRGDYLEKVWITVER